MTTIPNPDCDTGIILPAEVAGARRRSGGRDLAGNALPDTIGPYWILAEVGRGGMGIVYSALDPRLKRPVALKVIQGRDPSGDAHRRFFREARIMARLGKHPNLVQVHDVNREGGRDYIVMDLVDGLSLSDALVDGPLAPALAAQIAEKVARALEHTHRHGLVHRDVKPSNVLLTRDGEPQLTDFGLAKDITSDERLSATGDILGTPSYMAPEQAEARPEVDARADVYGVGALLYHMATGKPPFSSGSWMGTVAMVLASNPTPPRALRPSIGRELEAVIEKALERDPARRYATAADLADDLGRWIRGEPVLARRRSLPRRLAAAARRRPVRAAAITAAVLLLAAGAAAAPAIASARRVARAEDLRTRAVAEADSIGRIALLDQALALDPASWQAFADRARARIDRAADQDRTNERFNARYDTDEVRRAALADCDRALGLNPAAAGVLLDRAELRERLGDAPGAAADYAGYAALDPEAWQGWFNRGRRRREAGDLRGALAHFDRAIAARDDRAELYVFRGSIRSDLRDIAGALADLDRAIVLDPRNAKAHFGRAHMVQFYKRDMKTAFEGFSKAIELDPADGNNYFARGNIRRMLKEPDLEGALADYKKAMELSPKLNGPPTNLGLVLLQTGGSLDEARAAFTKAIENDPKFGMNYFGRACCWLSEEPPRKDEARTDLDRAIERDSGHFEPHLKRAELRREAGDHEGAKADYEVAKERLKEGSAPRKAVEAAIEELAAKVAVVR